MKPARIVVSAAVLMAVGFALWSWDRTKFPPRDAKSLERFLRQYVPSAEIGLSGDLIEAHQLQKQGAGYDDLSIYYLAFSCKREAASKLIGHGARLDNSIIIDPVAMTIDVAKSERVSIRPSDDSGGTFPDVFYENLDLASCDRLLIRKGGAPDWYSPDSIRKGLADRCVWGRGRVLVEFYFDEDREMMFIRIDELRPS